MTHPSAATGVFRQPFSEQVAFFRQKLGNRVPTRRWDDLAAQAHDTAFMVAGASEADLLTDLAAAVDKAIAGGLGIEAFRKDFRAIVTRNGWTGWTGEGSTGGEAWRVRTILRTNAYASYSAGRYAQLIQGNFAFWVYRHGGSLEPRPDHLSWNGFYASPDHPFWVKHYPPSDWGCSCYVLGASSARAAVRLGGDPNKRLAANWQMINPKTGQPNGIGKGWGYAPGASVAATVNAIAAKVGRWDYGIARTFMGGLSVDSQDALGAAYRALPSTADDTRRLGAAIFDGRLPSDAPKIVRSLGMVPSDDLARVEALIGKSVPRSDYRITSDFIRHTFAKHSDEAIERSRKQRPVTAADFARLPDLLNSPDTIANPGKSRAGETVVTYVRKFGSEIFNLVVVVNRRNEVLSLKTLYIGV